MPFNHLILCQPLLLPSIFPNESALRIRWPKYWSFSFNISPSNEHPRLISFRMDWLDLLAVPGTLKSLLQHHSSKASILQSSAFFTVQLSQQVRKWSLLIRGRSLCFHILFFSPSVLVLMLRLCPAYKGGGSILRNRAIEFTTPLIPWNFPCVLALCLSYVPEGKLLWSCYVLLHVFCVSRFDIWVPDLWVKMFPLFFHDVSQLHVPCVFGSER